MMWFHLCSYITLILYFKLYIIKCNKYLSVLEIQVCPLKTKSVFAFVFLFYFNVLAHRHYYLQMVLKRLTSRISIHLIYPALRPPVQSFRCL